MRVIHRQTGQYYATKILDANRCGFELDPARVKREIDIMQHVDHVRAHTLTYNTSLISFQPHIIRLAAAMIESDVICTLFSLVQSRS